MSNNSKMFSVEDAIEIWQAGWTAAMCMPEPMPLNMAIQAREKAFGRLLKRVEDDARETK